jgi:hypothetical protein
MKRKRKNENNRDRRNIQINPKGMELLKLKQNTEKRRNASSRISLRYQVLMAVSTKVTAFCDIAPCSFVEIDRRFRGAYYSHHQGTDDGDISQKAVIFTQLPYSAVKHELITDIVAEPKVQQCKYQNCH